MIPLVQTICLSILNGYDKRLYRSVILVVASLIKIVVTVVLIKVIGPWGAPVGTALAYLIGYCIALNLYYKNNLKLEVGRMFKEIFSGTWLCLAITTVLCLPLMLWDNYGITTFLIKGILYCAVFGFLMWKIGFTTEEKKIITPILVKLKLVK